VEGKVKYEPIGVRKVLTEMKDLSELMVDLAYSAILFNDREIAEEVKELESRVDHLRYILSMNAMIAVRDAEDAESMIPIVRVASAADKISEAAADIATIVLREIGVHPIVQKAFKRVEERLGRAEVKPDSILVGQTLRDLALATRIGVDLIAIRREKKWLINPKGDETISREDTLIARGVPSGVDQLKGLAVGTIRTLENRGQIMAQTKKPLNEIVDRLVELKNTSELMLDLAYSSLLLNSRELADEVQRLEEHVDDLHTEFGLLVLSSRFKPEESRGLLGLIQIGVATENIADAAAEIADVVLKGLEPHPVLRLVIEEAEETVTRVQVSNKSSLVGKSMRDAQIPEETGMWILAIRRGKKWIRPQPDTIIKAEDILIASGYAEGERNLVKLAS
jgi:uncharacterized protein with PhoU and TrkA domain